MRATITGARRQGRHSSASSPGATAASRPLPGGDDIAAVELLLIIMAVLLPA